MQPSFPILPIPWCPHLGHTLPFHTPSLCLERPPSRVPGELLLMGRSLSYEVRPSAVLAASPSVSWQHSVPACLTAFLLLYWDYLSLPLFAGYLKGFFRFVQS